jgi:Lon protease-like protein
VVFAGAENGTAAAIGCVGEVKKHEKLQDDRFFLICKGQQRFRVVDIVRTKPYLVGRVSLGESLATATPPLAVLARRRRMSFCVSLCCLLQVV